MTRRPFDAVLVVAFGGPEGLGDVRPFLRERPARPRRVAPERVEAVAQHYEHFGGVSPLAAITRRQVEGLRTHLAARELDTACVLGMRNWHPLLPDTLTTMAHDEISTSDWLRVCPAPILFELHRYREDMIIARQAVVDAGLSDVSVTYVGDWHHHDRFIEVNARHVRAALDTLQAPVRSAARLVFTAHSIPVAMVGRRAVSRATSGVVAVGRRAPWRGGLGAGVREPQRPAGGSLARARHLNGYLRAERGLEASQSCGHPHRLRMRSRRSVVQTGSAGAATVCREVGLTMMRGPKRSTTIRSFWISWPTL